MPFIFKQIGMKLIFDIKLFLGMFVPFKLPNQNACVESGLECPLEKGKEYKYEASFPVLKIYPKLDVEVKYELKNSKKVDIICVLIPVKIV